MVCWSWNIWKLTRCPLLLKSLFVKLHLPLEPKPCYSIYLWSQNHAGIFLREEKKDAKICPSGPVIVGRDQIIPVRPKKMLDACKGMNMMKSVLVNLGIILMRHDKIRCCKGTSMIEAVAAKPEIMIKAYTIRSK